MQIGQIKVHLRRRFSLPHRGRHPEKCAGPRQSPVQLDNPNHDLLPSAFCLLPSAFCFLPYAGGGTRNREPLNVIERAAFFRNTLRCVRKSSLASLSEAGT